ncbi:hypothetical protein DesLBE_3267 [Desulfitobacterium sp. LBE]|uniref:Uncharacterized protein n=1 Tax=bioreactor metagenome TaxID=1076179 RepID=A0A644TKV5_9ZZZZ|nr:hypothetical protein DesLBE_3267 [Desulfitobacterium sp. LBE]
MLSLMRYGAADSSRSQTQIRISSHTENDKVRFRSLETHFYYLYLHFSNDIVLYFLKNFYSALSNSSYNLLTEGKALLTFWASIFSNILNE